MLAGVLLLLCLTSWRVASDVTLNGNSYENINIVIEDNVPENETLLVEIQDSFAKASALLFNATRNHVYFGKCKIIVPLTWTKKDSYTQTPALSLTGSRILIGNVKNPIPHVRGIKRCGQSGEYMHLTPDFFMHGGRTKYGKRGQYTIKNEEPALQYRIEFIDAMTSLEYIRRYRPCSKNFIWRTYVDYEDKLVSHHMREIAQARMSLSRAEIEKRFRERKKRKDGVICDVEFKNMIKKPVCEICKENEHKYRCPQCRIVYCSLVCYKIHKDGNCLQKSAETKTEHTENLANTDIQYPEFRLSEEETEDQVSAEQLVELCSSEDLKELLGNPHLRHMMTSLVQTDNPAPLLEKAMQEPIFTEFADTCLSIIDNNKNDES